MKIKKKSGELMNKAKKIFLILCFLGMFQVNVFANVEGFDKNNFNDTFYIQSILKNAGYSLSVDGLWGNETETILKTFQNDHNINPTGEIDNNTIYAFQRYSSEVSRSLRSIQVESTAYSRFDYGCGNYTANGNFLTKGLVAVDPNVIPLGTRLYIEGYGYAIADDTGGAIKGNRIDLAFDSHEEAIQYGRKYINIYILG